MNLCGKKIMEKKLLYKNSPLVDLILILYLDESVNAKVNATK